VTTNFYGYDGLGSTRVLLSLAGAVVDTYTYDAFGILIASNIVTTNFYRYAGEQFDPDLGLYYLRNRYCSPDLGRFWTMDSFEGSQSDPLSLHKYLYAHDNPVNGIDPSGHEFTLVGTLTTAGIGATIGGLSSAVADYAHGRAITISSVAQGAAFGAVLGPLAEAYPIFAATLGFTGAGYSVYSFGPLLVDPKVPIDRKIAATGLLVASFYGAEAGFKYARTARASAASVASSSEGPTIRLFHKGQLDNGNVSSSRSLSLGVDKESVGALNRPGEVHEFEVPAKKLLEWEAEGMVERFSDLDAETGAMNQEVRVLAPRSAELNQYKK
jgi:RHS repeat-associated protein